MADDKFDKLLDAVLSGDRTAVDEVLETEQFTMLEYLGMPKQFQDLPVETKGNLAYVFQANPNVLPPAAQHNAPAGSPGSRS